MSSRYRANVPSQRVTPPAVFFDRRRFLAAFGAGLLAARPVLRAAASSAAQTPQADLLDVPFRRPDVFPAERNADYALPHRIANAVPILGQSSGLTDTRAPTPRRTTTSTSSSRGAAAPSGSFAATSRSSRGGWRSAASAAAR